MSGRQKRVTLVNRVTRQWPQWSAADVQRAIRDGEILVAGSVLTNPTALVGQDAAVRHIPATDLAGHQKLGWALEHFAVDATDRVVVDVGASTGGFTEAWLAAGAALVHAVDVGHGQLRGSLRQDPRVVTWERTNVGDLSTTLIADTVGAVSVDVSYLSLSSAVAQLAGLAIAPAADLLGLIKPMFELRLPTIPQERSVLDHARDVAVAGVAAAGWNVRGAVESPVRGGRGAVEFFLHAIHP
jgi:23S rRNA (cytidine1920-2'-O)/16S rRNA (cytidine1409-2'-O)-methyltransferase